MERIKTKCIILSISKQSGLQAKIKPLKKTSSKIENKSIYSFPVKKECSKIIVDSMEISKGSKKVL